MGRRDCLTNFLFFFTSSGAQRWAEREMGNTKKNTATLKHVCVFRFLGVVSSLYLSCLMSLFLHDLHMQSFVPILGYLLRTN